MYENTNNKNRQEEKQEERNRQDDKKAYTADESRASKTWLWLIVGRIAKSLHLSTRPASNARFHPCLWLHLHGQFNDFLIFFILRWRCRVGRSYKSIYRYHLFTAVDWPDSHYTHRALVVQEFYSVQPYSDFLSRGRNRTESRVCLTTTIRTFDACATNAPR